MDKYSTGNVIKTKLDNIIILTGDHEFKGEKRYDWISFSSTNMSGSIGLKTTSDEVNCYSDFCGGLCTDPDCVDCEGKSSYKRYDWGLEDSERLGLTVKDYIMKSLIKNFDFKHFNY